MNDIDRLLDKTYTYEEFQEMMSEFQVGQEVKLTDRCLLWLKENAYDMHTIGVYPGEDGVIKNEDTESLFIDLYLGNGLPYKATIIEFMSNVGNKEPGARILITLPNGQEKKRIHSVLNFMAKD